MNLTSRQAEILVKGCKNNERSAQQELYKLFHADMLRVCYSYLSDKELAKEAFNSGFLKVFQSINSFDVNKGELGGWIRKIMIYTAIDLCRSELKFNNVSLSENDLNEAFIPPGVLEKLYFEDILVLLRKLPKATQTIFVLSVLDGFTHKEISEQLHISEGTSRWHLSEAKRCLRSFLGQFDGIKGQLPERSSKSK